MSNIVKISNEDIIYHLKISCQIPGLLEAIASRQIITETAEKEGIAIEIAELQQSADSLRLVNNLVKAEDTWEWLGKHYLSLDNFEEIANLNLLSAKLAHHLFGEKIEPFFYAHQIDYSAAVTYEAVLDDEDLALELFYALKEGEISFQEIARQYIQNPEIRRAGGYQGIRKRSDFRPEIASAVFAANPPEILKPVITPKGVHIIVVEEIIAPELNEQVRIAILGDLFTNWLKEQINQLEIVATLADNTNFSHSSAEILSKAS
jgi:parvulin-like peptidyl-prolyl isomerase